MGVLTGVGFAASGVTVAGLVEGQAGTPITQASLSAITYAVYTIGADKSRTLVASGTLSISATVFDTAQTSDPRYTISGGYNFLATIPASAFATINVRYRINVTFIPATGEPFVQGWEFNAL